ncbi:MAG: hypothetical protein ABJN26_15350 [Stappiaceae bacterium]
MSNDSDFWEAKFVDAFVTKSKRSRYKTLLKNPKKREKILGRLNHNPDLDFSHCNPRTGMRAYSSELMEKLSAYHLEPQCWLLSFDSELDRKLLPLNEAVEAICSAFWGTVIICPPMPIAVYSPENMKEKELYLFT